MEPLPFVTIISLEVPVRVALVSVFPDVLPMRSWPSVYVVWPVPPFDTPRTPDKALSEGEVVADITPLVAWRKPVREVARVVAPVTTKFVVVALPNV